MVRPGSNVKPDVVVRVNLVQSNFTLRWDGVTIAHKPTCSSAVSCPSWTKAGSALGEQEVQVVQKGRVRIEPLQKNCDYLLDDFIQGAAQEFSKSVRRIPSQARAHQRVGNSGRRTGGVGHGGSRTGGHPGPRSLAGSLCRSRRNGAFI